MRVNTRYINFTRGNMRMYLWWSLCTLCLHACQVRVTVGDSGLCCCICVTYFERKLTPLLVDTCTSFTNVCSRPVEFKGGVCHTCASFTNVCSRPVEFKGGVCHTCTSFTNVCRPVTEFNFKEGGEGVPVMSSLK